MVPAEALRLLPPPRPNPDGTPTDGSPLSLRVGRGNTVDREFRVQAARRCPAGEQRIDRLRVRYRRLGRTISTELALDAPVTVSCLRGG